MPFRPSEDTAISLLIQRHRCQRSRKLAVHRPSVDPQEGKDAPFRMGKFTGSRARDFPFSILVKEDGFDIFNVICYT